MDMSSDAAEQSRLELLKSLEILDTPPEEVFDRLTKLAARICDAPMASLMLLDQDRQWFKSTYGWKPDEMPARTSFCSVTVDSKIPFVVTDASKDPRFAAHPFVAGPLGLRSYAGVPLLSGNGTVLGTLSVVDTVSRTFRPAQLEALEMLAEQVTLHFTLRQKRKEVEHLAFERDRSNAALRRQAEHLKKAQRIAGVGSWEVDVETGVVNWSDEIYILFGLTPDYVPGNYDDPLSLVHEEDRERVRAAVEAALRGEQPLELDGRIVRPDGEIRYTHAKGELTVGEGGRRILAGTVQDITEWQRAQAQLKLLRTCVDCMNEALIITEAEPLEEPGPRIVFVNDAFEIQTGYRREEAVGKSPDLLRGPATEREEVLRMRELLRNRVPASSELINYKKNGDPFWAEIDITPVLSASGKVSNFVAVRRDITERKTRQEQLEKMYRALQMLTRCNEALVRTQNEKKLLEAISRIAVEVGGYSAAWVGYARDDDERTIEPVAHAGAWSEYSEDPAMRVSWSADVPEGRGPAGKAVRTGQPVVCADVLSDPSFAPWRDLALKLGYRSVVSLPLQDNNRVFGVLNLLYMERRNMPDSELYLLQELADNLAFGISHLRALETRQRIEQAVLRIAAAVAASSGTEFFARLPSNMGHALGASAAFVARLVPGSPQSAYTLGAAIGERQIDNFRFDISGTPWEDCTKSTVCVLQRHGAAPAPIPASLAAVDPRFCISRRLDDASGKVMGLLCVLFREPVEELDFVLSTLQIFAARAASELERQDADDRIRVQASLLDKAKDAILVCGLDGTIRYWNKSAERIYGWTAEEAVGKTKLDLIVAEEDVYRQAFSAVLDKGDWSGDVRKRRKDGSTLMVEGHWTLVTDEQGRPDSILAIDTDITDRKAAEHEIERLAFFDPLTGLPNRRLLMDRLQHSLAAARRGRHTGALLFIDLDNFKSLNDTLGHDKGDQLLMQVARRLETCVPRKSDTVARLGGDEFVVLLEDLNHHAARHAEHVGEKIIAMFAEPFPLDGHEYHSTPSIGITLFDHEAKDVDELLKRADLAMYQAKGAGRNTIRFFDPDMQTVVSARVALESDLRQSLQRQDFYLEYQRQADSSGRTFGAEALVRWRHPRRGLMSPALFVPLAEETGLIMQLGQLVLETACRQLAVWATSPETAGLTLAVNVSPRQFRHPDFVKNVLRVLEQTGANPRLLKLELTESLLVENVEATVIKMTALKEHGVGFSLDDFGTGYSSLSYLKRLPLDQLKIDRSFVRDILTDPNDAAIARTIVALGQTLGLEVIAEGVETVEQRDFLARNGCHAYQGYLFSRPVMADQFAVA